ncbi:MAG: Tex family protein [Bacilli bacterium]
MDIIAQISSELSLRYEDVKKVISLLGEGNTVPFLARYRKEETGGMSDENLRNLSERLEYLNGLEERKKTVFASLDEQKVEDKELRKKIEDALTLSEVEDYYRPYKPKRVTRASKAKKAGLGPLATYILTDKTGKLLEEAKKYVSKESGFDTPEKAVSGAMDILAEAIADKPLYRTFLKDMARKKGVLETEKVEKCEDATYDNYAKYSRTLSSLKGYNILAINRGVSKKALTRKLILDDEVFLAFVGAKEIPASTCYHKELSAMVLDSYTRLIRPSVENDIYSELFDKASEESITEFKVSLKATLLESPLKDRRILGFDPGFTNGCKLAFIDENGKVLDTYVLPNPFFGSRNNAKATLLSLLTKNKTKTIALGNGTASRDSEKLIKELREENPSLSDLEYVIVSESGASIWSATADAQKEFPQFSPNLRSAVSLARRLEDPLAEMVKIPPESIGVGQYQYDIDSKKLKTALDGVVEDCVNYVGVNVNTASAVLLSHISGISSKLALSIVETREKNGPFANRQALKKVPGLGPKAFLNAAGFLRVPNSREPLDDSAVHPESYPIAKAILKSLPEGKEEREEALRLMTKEQIEEKSKELDVGEYTLTDILHELVKPTRDPRDVKKVAHLNESVTDIKDLKEGMILQGTIRNVAGFGFFVDLGIEINGLVHISEMADHYVSDPHTVGKPGDIVNVKVIGVDLKRGRISLSMKGVKQN